MPTLNFTLNGKATQVPADNHTLLVDLLRGKVQDCLAVGQVVPDGAARPTAALAKGADGHPSQTPLADQTPDGSREFGSALIVVDKAWHGVVLTCLSFSHKCAISGGTDLA